MNWNEHKRLFDKMIDEETDLLYKKGLEYAGDTDSLGNFKDCDDIGIDPKQKLWIFLSKHLSSIKSYIKNGTEYSTESIEGRINDARNYLALLYMLIQEEKAEKAKAQLDKAK